ncbi:MAG TPA: hypothetical protein VHD85_00400 [Terracidiphilus sp.]|nr:hypothetical protein [Terracidiphilus sp.]
MSVSAISSLSHAATTDVQQNPAPAPVTSKPSATPLPQDTVTLSSAGRAASQAGDVDHDGDSH